MSSELATKAFVKAEIDALRTETNARFERIEADVDELKADVRELKADVRQLKIDVRELKADVHQLKIDVRQLKTDVGELKTTMGEMQVTMGEMQITMRQIEIRARNGKLKNPIARIRPIPIFIHGRGAQEPDPRFFPKYADQLYNLRKPQKEHDRQMLAYLSKFYDIWQEEADQSIEEEIDPERAVELLEEILGLDEDNFVAFRAKAQLLANQGPTAEKRERPATASSGAPQPLRRKLKTPSDGSPTVPFTETPSHAPPRGPAPAGRAPSDGSPTVPFTETPSRAPPRGPAPSNGSPTVPFTETSTIPSTELPNRAAPERLSNIHTVPARPRHPSTIPDSEETASS